MTLDELMEVLRRLKEEHGGGVDVVSISFSAPEVIYHEYEEPGDSWSFRQWISIE